LVEKMGSIGRVERKVGGWIVEFVGFVDDGSRVDAGEVRRWQAVFEGDRDAALAYRAEIERDGRPSGPAGWAKQLGLSVALTDPEHRCEHFGDVRYCPSCVGEGKRDRDLLERENRRLVAENERLLQEVIGLKARLVVVADEWV
jgi:hypothetical protein